MSDDSITPGPYKGEGVFCNIATGMDTGAAEVKGGIVEIRLYNADVGGGRAKAPVAADGSFQMDIPGGMGVTKTATGKVNADCTEIHAKLDYHNGFTGEIGGPVTPGKTSIDECPGGN